MVTQTEIQERIKSDVHYLLMKNRINNLDLINCLIHLKMLLKKIDKISIVKDLEINNELKELETEKIDELEMLEANLNSRTIVLKKK